MIRIDHLSGHFGIEKIDELHLEMGIKLAVVGPNGSGKTTLLKHIFGLHTPKAGRVLINEHDAHRLPPKLRLASMSYLPSHETRVGGLTIAQAVSMAFNVHRSSFGKLSENQSEKLTQALKKVRLNARRSERLDTLSSGEYQRVRIARQLAQGAPIMLMDEPFTFLDPEHILNLIRIFRGRDAQQQTLIVSLHELNHAALCCDRVLLLNHGRCVLFDTTAEALQSDKLRRVFNVQFSTIKHPKSGQTHLLYPDAEVENE